VFINRIDLYRVAMPLISPWRTAYGEDAVIESVLVKMTGGELVGWGEASPLAAPTYSPEWAAGVSWRPETGWPHDSWATMWLAGDSSRNDSRSSKGITLPRAGSSVL